MSKLLYVIGNADAHPNLQFRLGLAGYDLIYSGPEDSTPGRETAVKQSDGVVLFPKWRLYRRNWFLVRWAKLIGKPVKGAETWIALAGK